MISGLMLSIRVILLGLQDQALNTVSKNARAVVIRSRELYLLPFTRVHIWMHADA
jgi:hypothetical protein